MTNEPKEQPPGYNQRDEALDMSDDELREAARDKPHNRPFADDPHSTQPSTEQGTSLAAGGLVKDGEPDRGNAG